jgi:hypothetical protein
MSRTHLYRATRPARPLGSIVLASAWCGAALAMLFTIAPGLMAGVALHGPAAGLQDRAAFVVAGGALLVGVLVVVSELVSGRTTRRGLRLSGAVLLALAGAGGLLDASRRVLRPGTPVSIAEAAPPLPGDDVALVNVARQRLLWTTAGLAGAALVLAGGIGALRSRDNLL